MLYKRLIAVFSILLLSYTCLWVYTKNMAMIEGEAGIVFSMPSGFYDDSILVTIDAKEGDIYYTLDGSPPSTQSIAYVGAITIDDASRNENKHCMRNDLSVTI